jgi:hypothetical protein
VYVDHTETAKPATPEACLATPEILVVVVVLAVVVGILLISSLVLVAALVRIKSRDRRRDSPTCTSYDPRQDMPLPSGYDNMAFHIPRPKHMIT